MTSRLVEFYRGKATDHAGRMLSDYWRFDNDQLEHEHGFIQWMFPLPVGSKYNKDAPVLMPGDIADFANCQDRFAKSLGTMMAFYANTTAWRNYHDHNHLRITRILKCMRILYSTDPNNISLRFFQHIMVRARPSVNPISKEVWWAVVSKPVYTYEDALNGP